MMDYVKSSHNVQICLNEEMVLTFRVNPDGSLCIIAHFFISKISVDIASIYGVRFEHLSVLLGQFDTRCLLL